MTTITAPVIPAPHTIDVPPDSDPVGDHVFTVTVSGCTRAQAEQLIADQLREFPFGDPEHDFDYRIDIRETP